MSPALAETSHHGDAQRERNARDPAISAKTLHPSNESCPEAKSGETGFGSEASS